MVAKIGGKDCFSYYPYMNFVIAYGSKIHSKPLSCSVNEINAFLYFPQKSKMVASIWEEIKFLFFFVRYWYTFHLKFLYVALFMK